MQNNNDTSDVVEAVVLVRATNNTINKYVTAMLKFAIRSKLATAVRIVIETLANEVPIRVLSRSAQARLESG